MLSLILGNSAKGNLLGGEEERKQLDQLEIGGQGLGSGRTEGTQEAEGMNIEAQYLFQWE